MAQAWLSLIDIERKESGSVVQNINYTYTGKHNNLRTTLSFTVTVRKEGQKYFADIHFGPFKDGEACEGATLEEALKRLGNWCSRAGEVLANIEPKETVPIEFYKDIPAKELPKKEPYVDTTRSSRPLQESD